MTTRGVKRSPELNLAIYIFSSLFYGFIVFSAHTGTKEASEFWTAILNYKSIMIVIKLAWAAHISLIFASYKKALNVSKFLSDLKANLSFSDFPLQ